MKLKIDEWTVEVQYKRIKHMYLRVKVPHGDVHVSAPVGTSNARIAAFVRLRADWIRRQQARIAEMPAPVEPTYSSGERAELFGRFYPLRVETVTSRSRVLLDNNMIVLQVKKGSTPASRAALLKEWYRAKLKEQIERYLPKWEAITGLYAASWQIKDMRTRWGTCNTGTKKIWINLWLAKKPIECLEYVLLHELAHLRVSNHGKDFQAILDYYMPEWREVRKRMNGR